MFLDETGADRRNCLRRFGYSLRGKPAVSKKLLVCGQRISAIAVMSTWTVTLSLAVNSSKFSNFVQQALLPQLQPFNGVNARSVVVLDNASIHHVDGVVNWSTGGLPSPPIAQILMLLRKLFLN